MTPGRKPSSSTSARSHQRPHHLDVAGVLEVQRDRALAAVQQRRRAERADQPARCPRRSIRTTSAPSRPAACRRTAPVPARRTRRPVRPASGRPPWFLLCYRGHAVVRPSSVACCPTPTDGRQEVRPPMAYVAGRARRGAGCAGPLGGGRGAPDRPGGWPWATLLVNLTGCLLLGRPARRAGRPAARAGRGLRPLPRHRRARRLHDLLGLRGRGRATWPTPARWPWRPATWCCSRRRRASPPSAVGALARRGGRRR